MTGAAAPTLVVAGLSARAMAEAAARDGYRVIALDAFGDLDTRRCAQHWAPIGVRAEGSGALRLEPGLTLAALRDASREPGVIGWVAGSDFECEPALLASGAGVLPLLGTPPAAVRRVRDPRSFFDALARHGFSFPPTRLEAPADARDWLRKLALGSGGWHIRAADDPRGTQPARLPYFQQRVEGVPMSVLFLAHGSASGLQRLAPTATRIGCQQLLVRPLGAHPFVYRGAIGPLPLPLAPARLAWLDVVLDTLANEFGLRGLASLDFVDDGEHCWLLEVNPRPSASMLLYGGGLMRAHVAACLGDDELGTPAWPDAAPGDPLRGSEIVFARGAFTLDAAQSAALAARTDCHDLPAACSRFDAGDPVCSVSAGGADVAAVHTALAAKRRALRDAWAKG